MRLEARGGKLSPPEQSAKLDQNAYGIEVVRFIKRYDVKDIKTKEALQSFPTLCYLLGNVTNEPQGNDPRPDGINRPVFYLTDGSGMFGLKNPEDAMRWRGIFNHIMGSATHAYFLSEHIYSLSEEKKNQFWDLGFDLNSFQKHNPTFLRDFMFVNHAARRRVDERKWHALKDAAHPEGESEPLTTSLLTAEDASNELVELMREEDHEYLGALGKKGRFLNIAINILTYSDWTFGQEPTSLQDRFKNLRESKRQPEEILDALEKPAIYFERALKKVLGPDIHERMVEIKAYDWETQIREAYCSSSGLDITKTFPNFLFPR